MAKIVDARGTLVGYEYAEQIVREMNAFDELLAACNEAAEAINSHIERRCNLADDTAHPLWPVVEKLCATARKASPRKTPAQAVAANPMAREIHNS